MQEKKQLQEPVHVPTQDSIRSQASDIENNANKIRVEANVLKKNNQGSTPGICSSGPQVGPPIRSKPG